MTVVGFAPGTALASSHREAPLTSADPLADNTDVYAFVSPDDANSVTVIANWIPFEEPNGGPNFYPWGTIDKGYRYDINIDNTGDGVADTVYRWEFSTQDGRTRGTADLSDDTFLYNDGPVTSLTDDNLLFRQTYDLQAIPVVAGVEGTPVTLLDNAPVAPSSTGLASMPNYETDLFNAAITPIAAGGITAGKSYAGQADDPFFLDLRVFDLLYGGGVKADSSGLNEVGEDTLAGYNVNTVALQLPKSAFAQNGDATANPVTGIWSTTERQSVDLATGTASGGFVQVSRLGQPLVNEVVLPTSLKDAFNSISPDQDAAAGGGEVLNRVLDPEVPKLIEGIFGIPAPDAPRTDIAEIFLTGITTALDGSGFYASLGDPADTAPIAADLNSQLLNADNVATDFQPSEMLRLNMSINAPTPLDPTKPVASSLGVVGNDLQGFPNGRRLTDDVVDIELVALGGQYAKDFTAGDTRAANAQATTLVALGGDQVGVNDKAFRTSFPYIAAPSQGSVNQAQGGVQTVVQPAPTTAAPGATTPPAAGATSGVRTPTGGVDTGAGGSTPGSSALPLVTGTAAVLLLAAGGASILSNRRKRAAAGESSAE